jgi:hypothetical protein
MKPNDILIKTLVPDSNVSVRKVARQEIDCRLPALGYERVVLNVRLECMSIECGRDIFIDV